MLSIIQPFVNEEVNQYFKYALLTLKIILVIWILAYSYLFRNLMRKYNNQPKRVCIKALMFCITLFGACWFIYYLRSGLDASSYEQELSWYNKIRNSQLEFNLLKKELFLTIKYGMYANGLLALCFLYPILLFYFKIRIQVQSRQKIN